MRKIAYIMGERGSCTRTNTLDDIMRVAEEFKRAGVEILGINGGDGTIHVTLTTFIKVYGDTPLPRVALLRGGTMNTIAADCGITGTTAEILHNMVEKYHVGEEFSTVKRDIMHIGDHYGFIFGNGVIHNFLDEYYRTGNPGPRRAAAILARGVASAISQGQFAKNIFRRFRARVTVDGERWPQEDFTAVCASTVELIGLGFRPFIRYEERPGTFHLLGITTNPGGFARELWRIYRGQPLRRDRIIEAVAEEVIFESDVPLLYTIDGDTHRCDDRLRLTAGPRLEIIVG